MTQDEIDLMLSMTRDAMQKALEHLQEEVTRVRTGKASPVMFDGVFVDYYGSSTPLSQVATVKSMDARTLSITPWEKNMIRPIEKAIFEANLGVTPQNDGIMIRINIPPLTEERRRELLKGVANMLEHAKVSIRNARRDALEDVKKAVKDGFSEDAGKRTDDEIQKMTNEFVAKAEQIFAAKEKDMMTL